MTISAKLREKINDFDNVSSPGSPEEACAKSDDARSGIIYEHNDEIIVAYQPAKALQEKKISDLSLVDKTKMKGRLVDIIAGPMVLNLKAYGARETGPISKAKNRGMIPSKGVSRFGTLYHKCSDVTVRAPKKSFGFGQASPFYAFVKIKTEELDKLLDGGPKKSKSPVESLKTKAFETPPNEDGSINKEGLTLDSLVEGLKEGLVAVGQAIGEEIEKAELKELDDQTNELLAELALEEEEKRGTSTDENDLSPTQRDDVPEAIKRNLDFQVFLNNEIVSIGAQNAATVLEYYIEVLDENDPPIDPVDLKGINLLDELEKLAKLEEYFEDFKDMNGLGTGTDNTVTELRAMIDFPVVFDEGEDQGGGPRIVGFDDRSVFAEGLRADPAIADIFQPEEDEVDGTFFSFKTPFDERTPSFTGAILDVVDTIGDMDHGGVTYPAQTPHPAYDKLANIEGEPQPVPELGGPDFTTYTLENLPNRIIKEIDITAFTKRQGNFSVGSTLYGFGIPEGEVPELIYTIKYLDQRQINLAPGDILANYEIEFANRRSVASIPRQLLQINIYEKVKQPNADKVKITLDSKIKPILFETELDKIEAVGDLEFDFRPARFSGLGISPDVTQGEGDFGADNNGKNAFPGYTPTTWSILKNLKLINEELSKLGSGGATPWTEFLPKIFVPAVALTQEEIDQLCKKGQIERADEVSRRRAGGSTQDNKEPPLTALEDPKVDKQAQKPASVVVADPSVEASRIKIKQQQKTALRETVELSVTDALVTCNSGLVKQIKSLADILALMGRVDFATMIGALAKNLAADVLLQQAILNKLNEQGLLPEELAAEFIRCGGEVSEALDILNDLVPSILNTLNDPNRLKNLAFDGVEDALKFLFPNLSPLPFVPNLDIYGFIRLLLVKGIKIALIQLLGALLKEAIQELLGCNGESLLDSLIAKAAEGLDLDIDIDAFGNIKDGLNLSRLLPAGVDQSSLLSGLLDVDEIDIEVLKQQLEAFYDAISAALTGEELRTMIYDTPTSGQIFRTVRSVADRIFDQPELSDPQITTIFASLRGVIPPARFDAYIPFRDGSVICNEGELDDAANKVLENASAMGIDPADLAQQFVDALCDAAEESNKLADLLKPGGLQKAMGSAVQDLLDNTEQPDEVKSVLNQAAAATTQASVTLVKQSETVKQYLSGIKTKGPSATDEFKFVPFKPGDFDNTGLPISKFWVAGTPDVRQELLTRVGSETNVTYNSENDVFVKNLKEGENLVLSISEATPESAVFSIAKEGENLGRQVLAEVSTAGAFSYTDIQNEEGRNLLRATLAQTDQINGTILNSTPFQRRAAVEDKFTAEISLYFPNDDEEAENYIRTYRQRVVDRMNIDKVMQGISDACMESMPKNLSAGPLAIVRKDKCHAAAQIVYAELMRFYFAVIHYTGAVNRRDDNYFFSDQDTVLTQLVVDYIARRVRQNNNFEIIEDVEKIVASLDRSPTRRRQRFFSSTLFSEDKLKEFIYKCLTYFDRDDDGTLFLTATSNNEAAEDAREYLPNGYTIGQGEEAELLTPTDRELNNYVVPLEGIVAMQIMWASEYDLPGELGLKFDDFLASAKRQYNDSKRLLAGNSLSEPEKGN
jgi:hypothetical protein